MWDLDVFIPDYCSSFLPFMRIESNVLPIICSSYFSNHQVEQMIKGVHFEMFVYVKGGSILLSNGYIH